MHHLVAEVRWPRFVALADKQRIVIAGPVDAEGSGLNQRSHRIGREESHYAGMRNGLRGGSEVGEGQPRRVPGRAILAEALQQIGHDAVVILAERLQQRFLVQHLIVGWQGRALDQRQRAKVDLPAGRLQQIAVPVAAPTDCAGALPGQIRGRRGADRRRMHPAHIRRRSGERSTDKNLGIHGLHRLGECQKTLRVGPRPDPRIALALPRIRRARDGAGAQVELGRMIRAIVAVVPRVVADLPQLNPNRLGMADAQPVVAVVRSDGIGCPQTRPVAHGLPVVALGVLADRLRAGRVAVGVGYPSRRLGRLTPSAAIQIAAVVHAHDGAAEGIEKSRQGRKVIRGRKVRSLPLLVGIDDPGGQGKVIDSAQPAVARIAQRLHAGIMEQLHDLGIGRIPVVSVQPHAQ